MPTTTPATPPPAPPRPSGPARSDGACTAPAQWLSACRSSFWSAMETPRLVIAQQDHGVVVLDATTSEVSVEPDDVPAMRESGDALRAGLACGS